MGIIAGLVKEHGHIVRRYQSMGRSTPKMKVICNADTFNKMRIEREAVAHMKYNLEDRDTILGMLIDIDNAAEPWRIKVIK